MSDANLLTFGCAVSFIALGGAYVYLRECWTARGQSSEPEVRHAEAQQRARDAA